MRDWKQHIFLVRIKGPPFSLLTIALWRHDCPNLLGYSGLIRVFWLIFSELRPRTSNFELGGSGSSSRKVSHDWLVTLWEANGTNNPGPRAVTMTAANKKKNRPFPSCLYLCFKTILVAQPFIWIWDFLSRSLSCTLNSFPYERLCTRTRFEAEGKSNTERAYYKLTRADTLLNFWQVSKPSKSNIFC